MSYCHGCEKEHAAKRWRNAKDLSGDLIGLMCNAKYAQHMRSMKQPTEDYCVGCKRSHIAKTWANHPNGKMCHAAHQRLREPKVFDCGLCGKEHPAAGWHNYDGGKICHKMWRLKTRKGQYSTLKSEARQPKKSLVDLSFDEFCQIREMPCHYCIKDVGDSRYRLDRRDNTIRIYNSSNAVSCCWRCNNVKGEHITEFEMLAVAAAFNQYEQDGIVPPKIIYPMTSVEGVKPARLKYRYNCMVQNAAAKNRAVTINISDYLKIIRYPCTFCGGPLPPCGSGIDRLDPHDDYNLFNVVPCCGFCNTLKGDILLAEETFVAIHAIQTFRGNPRNT